MKSRSRAPSRSAAWATSEPKRSARSPPTSPKRSRKRLQCRQWRSARGAITPKELGTPWASRRRRLQDSSFSAASFRRPHASSPTQRSKQTRSAAQAQGERHIGKFIPAGTEMSRSAFLSIRRPEGEDLNEHARLSTCSSK
jgi:hypothetical protein